MRGQCTKKPWKECSVEAVAGIFTLVEWYIKPSGFFLGYTEGGMAHGRIYLKPSVFFLGYKEEGMAHGDALKTEHCFSRLCGEL